MEIIMKKKKQIKKSCNQKENFNQKETQKENLIDFVFL